MACYYPWAPRGAGAGKLLACGQCHGCRLEYARQWAVRCVHEASLHDVNCFITLTYREAIWSLLPEDLSLFWKRLRARVAPVRFGYYAAGEYGERNSRPHYHACVFGFDFSDKVYFKKSPAGYPLYRSSLLESVWPHGFSSVGRVTLDSAGYVARYVMKKVSGRDVREDIIDPNTGEVFSRHKEFARMSLKPAIGKIWISRYMSDVYPDGEVVIEGVKARAPKFYDVEYRKRGYGNAMLLSGRRRATQEEYFGETLPKRLEARRLVSIARVALSKRGDPER